MTIEVGDYRMPTFVVPIPFFIYKNLKVNHLRIKLQSHDGL